MTTSFPGTGENRLEVPSELGRPFRVGSPMELARSNAEVIRKTIKDRKSEEAKHWIEYLYSGDMVMLRVYAEWCVLWHEFSLRRFGSASADLLQQQALELWNSHTNTAHNKSEAKMTTYFLLSTLRSDSGSARCIEQLSEGVCRFPEELNQMLMENLLSGCGPETEDLFENYFRCVRDRHDLLAKYCWSFPTAICKIHGQKIAEEGLAGSFGAMSVQDAMWNLFASLSPALRSAFLAEHLRFHFSGIKREGSVTIIEEEDRYRLVFDPCGSGGAMRREGLGELTIFANASPLTWGRKGEVPAYCAHCAFNELTSVKRVGYPLWVTEFDPDANRPCGWTVFKDPGRIPQSYFSRLSQDTSC